MHVIVDDIVDFDFDNTNLFGKILIFVSELMSRVLNLGIFRAYMQKTCDVAEKAILAKKNLGKKCVNRDKM